MPRRYPLPCLALSKFRSAESRYGTGVNANDFEWSDVATRALAIIAVLIGASLLSALARVFLRQLTRRALSRALSGKGRLLKRLPRSHDVGGPDPRPGQRADAAAQMLARIASLVITISALLIILRILELNPLVLVSSAGFLGAGVAIGGQALIKDWLTGLMVLLEDRYAVGDDVTVRVGGQDVSGRVETLTSAALRIRLTEGSTWHAGHGSVESVTNHSQLLPTDLPAADVATDGAGPG